MRKEWLQRTHVNTLAAGDEFVSPGYATVWGVDKDGYATLSPTVAGTRYRITDVIGDVLSAVPVAAEGLSVTSAVESRAKFNDQTTVLKVVQR